MKKKVFQHKLQEIFTRYPDRTALEYGNLSVTYGELDNKSSSAAAWILGKGIEPGTFIGILVEDRADLVTAIIGILKAGCAFVPLSSALPRNRIEAMLEATQLGYIFIDDINARRFPSIKAGGEAIETMNFRHACALRENRGPAPEAEVQYDPEGPVYIYFTSGTTGTPKAVVGRNKSLLHFIEWEIDTFKLDCTSRVSQFTIPTFDPYLRDIFVPLLAGGAVVIPGDKDVVLESTGLREWLNAHRIVLTHCVTSLFRLLCRNPLTPGDFKDLEYILLAGEKTNPSDLIYWYGIFGDRVRLVNLYGPTETTLAKIYYPIKPADVQRERIPIGKPIKGARAVILDEKRNICDELEIGEIAIRTPYRSLGYYNDPGLNRDKFIQNPFTDDPKDIIYLSGDLGRMLPDGNIDILGRVDRQVKIRGMRIELDEIESALIKRPGVREAVVLKRELAENNEILHGFITLSSSGQSPAGDFIDSVKEDLGAGLPDYMVPAIIQIIEQLPLRANGKVDYEALKEQAARYEKKIVPPRNAVEKKLHALWAELLGREKFGIGDSFFELGGNSLTIMSLITKIHKEFDVRISLGEIFNNLTIEKQAGIISGLVEETCISIEPVEEKEYYPLSPAQARLYILQQLDKESTGYHISQVIPLKKAPEKKKLTGIFRRLINRHESLRTSFLTINDRPVQQIHPAGKIEFSIENQDTPGTPGARESRQSPPAAPSFIRPFDLAQAPLMRAGLQEQETGTWLLLIDIHHITADGLSVDLLAREFFALERGENLPPLRLQYKDYTLWQLNERNRETIKEQEAYWLKEFSGEIPVLSRIPTDYERPAVVSFEGSAVSFALESKTTKALKELCRHENVTMFMLLLAAFSILAARLDSGEDVVVGTPIAGRSHPDLEKIIGMFVNTLALRNYPRGDRPFIEFLRELKDRTVAAFENQEYPFEELVDKVAVRDTGRNPLFDIMFALNTVQEAAGDNRAENREDAAPAAPAGSGFTRHGESSTKFDLILTGQESPADLSFIMQYSTKIFKVETIERFIGYFTGILSSIAGNPRRKIAGIEILSEEEKRLILFEFNDTEVDFPHDKTIHRLFEEQVEKTPESKALTGESAILPAGRRLTLTYRELNEKANQLARLLRKKGVKPGVIVGILPERAVEMMVGILAVIKAGGAYLPLDPDYPRERIRYILGDSGSTLFLTWKNLRPLIETGGGIIEIDDNEIYRGNAGNLEEAAGPGDLLYVIYTSGSTGRPKGVMIEHRPLANFIKGITGVIPFSTADCILSLTTISFDIFGLETLLPLTKGARVIIGGREEQVDPKAAALTISGENVTILQVTPSRLSLLLSDAGSAAVLNDLEYLLVGGEALPAPLLEKARQVRGGKIYNLYGPTETTIWSAIKDVSRGESLNIGAPIANTQIYILGKGGILQPLGVPGDLYIAGAGLARGYINNPELTAGKFDKGAAHPASAVRAGQSSLIAGHRSPPTLYSTGDLARWLPGGNIEFLGRLDHQVKIRGFRIELGEIENRLQAHARVKEAVVIAKTGAGQRAAEDRYLLAYLVTRDSESLTVSELKEHLSTGLPDYMIPNRFVHLEKIPLTANGKVDYKALDDSGKALGTGIAYEAPHSEAEKAIAAVWQEVLEIEKVGKHDNFFEIGGNSLRIITVYNRLINIFDRNIPIVNLFRYTTVASLAGFISSRDEEEKEVVLIDEERAAAVERGKQDRQKRLQRRKRSTT
ncbi:MAG: amino acid adenylation domain-containing protein [Candidatus Aminicenantes bacterium]|nr:amino acid adenylation domain-containing protein [Candidatus Aminicenantes bacterium]